MILSKLQPKHRRLHLLLALFFGLGAALFVGLILLREEMMFFMTPTQLLAHSSHGVRRPLRLGGHVQLGSLESTVEGVRFQLTDGYSTIEVHFQGMLPALFRMDQSAIVEGFWRPSDQIFEATAVLAKHDENYAPPETCS